jgi:parallel beta-helix repeat protein
VDVTATEAAVDVAYDITFDDHDRQSGQVYEETCRLMGDDTNVGDPPQAGADDTLGFLTPLFTRDAAPAQGSPTLSRHFTKTFRKLDLDEDRGPIPNPDEIRAVVTLKPLTPPTGRPIRRESNLVSKNIDQGPGPTPPPPPPPPPPTATCGQEITQSTTLTADLTCPTGPALIVAADNIVLDLGGHTVSGNPNATSPGPGILLRNVKGCTVRNGTVQRFGAGIVVAGGANNAVQSVVVQDNIGTPDGDFGDGIVLDGSSNNRVVGNAVRRNGPFSGISMLAGCQDNEITNNVVTDNNMMHLGDPSAGRQDMGIRIEGPAANRNKIMGNTVTGSGANGIVVLPTCTNPDANPPCAGTPPNEGNEISDNTSNNNGTSGQGHGVAIFSMPNPIAPTKTNITGNIANNNRASGISIDAGSTQNQVRRNTAHGNGRSDGFDGNSSPPCGANVWEANDFGIVNQPCARGVQAVSGQQIRRQPA